MKSIWSTSSPTSINLPQFIADLDNVLSCQLHHVKKALSSKHSINRLTKESQLASSLKQGDIVFKRAPGINRCLEASWDGPFVICDLIPPVNDSIQGTRFKIKTKSCASQPIEKINFSQPMSLYSSQQQQLDHVLNSFPSVFSDIPGETS